MTVWVLAAVAAVLIWSWGTGSRAELASLGWYEIFFLFVSSAFLGDCFETVFVWLTRGVLMSRSSLLYAPLSLVWGLGAVLMTLALFPLARKGNLALFTAGAVLGGGFEYLASLVLELATNRLFWDYSNIPLNLDGRTNLWFALFWGAAAVFWVRIAAPGLLRLLKKIPRHGGQVAALVVAVMLMADVSLSAAALLRMEERDRGAAPSNRVEQVLDTWYSDAVLQVRYQNMQLPVADAA